MWPPTPQKWLAALPRTLRSIDWWATFGRVKSPVLEPVAQRYLGCSGHNSHVERMPSTLGNYFTDKRQAMKPEKLGMLAFLGCFGNFTAAYPHYHQLLDSDKNK